MTSLRVSSKLCALIVLLGMLGCAGSKDDNKKISPTANSDSNGGDNNGSSTKAPPPKYDGQIVDIRFRGTQLAEWTPPREPKEYIGSAILVLEDNKFPLTVSGKEILGQVYKIVAADAKSLKFDRPLPNIGQPGDRYVTLKCRIVAADTVGKRPPTMPDPDPVGEAVDPASLKGTWEGSGAADVSSLAITFGDDGKCKIVYKIGNTTYTVTVSNTSWHKLPDGRLGLAGLGGLSMNMNLRYVAKNDSLRVSGNFRTDDNPCELKDAELVRPGKQSSVWVGSGTGVAANPNGNPNGNPNVGGGDNLKPILGRWEAGEGTPGFKSFVLDFKTPFATIKYETEDKIYSGSIPTEGFKQGANKRLWVYQEVKGEDIVRDVVLELSENGKILSITGSIDGMNRVRDLALLRADK
ncbi:MAG: hypothetical protein AB7K24_21655 [Gemmataceae bacterium]